MRRLLVAWLLVSGQALGYTIEGGMTLDGYIKSASTGAACGAAVAASAFWQDAVACLHGRSFHDDKNLLKDACAESDVVTGILPLIAARALLPTRVVHVVQHGMVWASRATPAQVMVPCRLLGKSTNECSHATLIEKLHMWCDVNRRIWTDVASPVTKRVGEHHFVYQRQVVNTGTEEAIHGSMAWQSVPEDLKDCVEEVWG